MSDLVIGDYTAAITIDGSTHYLLIQPGSSSTAYKKITRDVLLGVTGQPADISTAQNFTNKTLDVTNVLTLRDDRFTLQDSGDVTRQATFQLSGITAGNTRVMTLPDASTTLVGTGTTQTLTNKTLTSPTISGGTIDNSTITVDAIGEHTATNGVTIDGLNIKDGALNTNNSVVTANVTDAAITPAKLLAGTGSGWTWSSWSPTWTNFSLGNGTVSAVYIQTGKTVFARLSVILGNTSSMTGALTFTLPVTSSSSAYSINTAEQIGTGSILDAGTAVYQAIPFWNSTTTCIIRVIGTAGTYANHTDLTGSIPMTWTTSDAFAVEIMYEAA